MTVHVINHMYKFLLVCLIIVWSFTIIHVKLDNMNLTLLEEEMLECDGDNRYCAYQHFGELLYGLTLVSFAADLGYFEDRSTSVAAKICILVQVVVSVVVLLNLLIAIISDTFDFALENQIASDS